jgi:hypothetical protein
MSGLQTAFDRMAQRQVRGKLVLSNV